MSSTAVGQNNPQDLELLPPTAFNSGEIAARALRKIGAFPINDAAPAPNELAEALYWLDLIVAELAGKQECFWLRPATMTQDLTVDEPAYTLSEFDEYPPSGIVFPMKAWIRDPSGNDEPIKIIRRTEYEDLPVKDTAGTPECIYVDRIAVERNLFTYPVIAEDGYQLRLLVQTYHHNLTGSRGENSPSGDVALRIGAEWQRFLVFMLSADIGDGPIRRIDDGKVKEWRAIAGGALAALNSFTNRERPRAGRTRRWGG